MAIGKTSTVALAAFLLCGCGGGGGVNSISSQTPTPTPTPSPVPTTLTDLNSDHVFGTDSAKTTASLNLTSKTTVTSSAYADALTISYDASSQSYSLTTPDRSETFTGADVQAGNDAGQTVYKRQTANGSDYLTLVKVPYTSTQPTKYVGLGYWQQNDVCGDIQNMLFDTFTYGFTTAETALPRSGQPSYGVDVFGLAAKPGLEPRVFEGHGSFDTDFLAGVYSTDTYLTETGLISGNSISGGNIELTGSGNFSASGGSFGGFIWYGGQDVSLAGDMAGHFYGPTGQEMGATFSAYGGDGSSVNGSMTGALDPKGPAVNLTLTNMVAPQLFYTQGAQLSVTHIPGGQPDEQVRTWGNIGQLDDQTGGNFTLGMGYSDQPSGAFTIASGISSADPNFVSYDQQLNGQDVHVDLYKPGPSNTELPLTYTSLGRWRTTEPQGGQNSEDQSVYFVYGLETPAHELTARTGSAQYSGVVYGAGANAQTRALYDVTGTSQFNVDFSDQNFTGALVLKGTSTNGAGSADFGSYSFGGPLAGYLSETDTNIVQGSNVIGTLSTRFYGPEGEEIGGPFTLTVPTGSPGEGTQIAGATVARHQ